MRRQIAALMLGGFVAVWTTPLVAAPGVVDEARQNVPTAVAVQRVSAPSRYDEAAMVLIGTMLIGVAAAVRRATA